MPDQRLVKDQAMSMGCSVTSPAAAYVYTMVRPRNPPMAASNESYSAAWTRGHYGQITGMVRSVISSAVTKSSFLESLTQFDVLLTAQ